MAKLIYPALLSLLVGSVTAYAQAGDAKQQAARAGQQVFSQRCMMCHSVNKDQVMLGPSLWSEMTHSPHKKSAAEIRDILKHGKGKMPPAGGLTDDDVANLLAYLHSL
jgi:mono/diheme cytochrome c family protein